MQILPKLLITACILQAHSARASALFYEGFNYTAGTKLGTAGGGWSGSLDAIKIAGGNLSFAGLQASAGNMVSITSAGTAGINTGSKNDFAATDINSGAVYFSFLLRLSDTTGISAATPGTPLVNMNHSGSGTKAFVSVNVLNNSGSIAAGIVKYPEGTTPSSSAFFASGPGSALSADGSTTYLFVGKYRFVPGVSNDVVTLWVNPTSLGGGEDSVSPQVSTSAGADNSNSDGLGRLYIDAGYDAAIDELRISTNWADVTPSSGPLPPPAVPYVTQALVAPAGFVLHGTNGPASSAYIVLGTSNVALAGNRWLAVATNTFGADGTFGCTNPLPPGAVRQFYRLLVGTNLPPIPLAPVITNQPQSQTVGAGQTATFSVGAGGTAPLVYQWYFNTNTTLSGATNASVSLLNVQTNQTGGYSVVVANGAGSLTSLVATLTVTNTGPALTTQPQDRTVFAGQSATFTVTATGSAPLMYQWFFNTNTLIQNATNSGLTLNNVQTNDAGGYSVTVGNMAGSVTSIVARLAVNPAPVGNSYYVATTGSDSNPGTIGQPWRTLQKAANTLAPADTVFVRGGVYNEAVTFHVSGSATGGYITFQNYPGETAVVDGTGLIVPPSDYAVGLFEFTNGGFVILQGFEIRNYQTNSSSLVPAGIGITAAAHDILLISNRVHDIVNLDSNGNAYGIEVHGTLASQPISNLVIRANELFSLKTGWSESMTLNGNVTNFEVCSNIIHDNYNIGIDFIGFEGTCPDTNFDRARHGTCHDNIVWNCSTFSNPNYKEYSCAGIYVDGGTDIVVERNRTFFNDIGIEMASEHKNKATSFVTCRDNLIWSNAMGGIFIGGYSSGVGRTEFCTMTHNTLYHNDTLQWGQGEWLLQFDARSNTFTHNILVVANWENNWLIGNTFTQNTNNLADWNLYYTPGGAANAKWQWKKTNYTGFSNWQSATGNDAHSLFADPLLLDPALPDLHIATNSPAVNAGDSAFVPGAGETDLDGDPRVIGARTDIGADEVNN